MYEGDARAQRIPRAYARFETNRESPGKLGRYSRAHYFASLYTPGSTWWVWSWNPYNNTGALKVCVVNEDEGAHNDLLGDLQLGDQIMDQLHENTQLNCGIHRL